ncbi:MAG: cytidine deaminase [Bacteroidales bacterium]|jgi:cytidine deaminase
MITNKTITITYKEFNMPEELDPPDMELLVSARKIALNAYAPYSHLRVGAAIRLASGKIILGTNVENAAFPSGICAERAVLSNASSNYPGDKPEALAVAAVNENNDINEILTPCGNCRQVIAEEELRNNSNIRIILDGKDKIYVLDKGSDLLPLQFSKNNLTPVPGL